MVITFSEEEKRYLLPYKGNWQVKDNCPDNIKKRLEEKIRVIAEANSA